MLLGTTPPVGRLRVLFEGLVLKYSIGVKSPSGIPERALSPPHGWLHHFASAWGGTVTVERVVDMIESRRADMIVCLELATLQRTFAIELAVAFGVALTSVQIREYGRSLTDAEAGFVFSR